MEERRQNMNDLTIDVGVMKNNITMLSNLAQKFDTTIDKLKDISNDTAKLVASLVADVDNQEKTLNTHKGEDNTKFEQIMTSLATFRKDIDFLKRYLFLALGGGFVILTAIEIYISNH